jgi:hypothetical protein
MRQVSIRVAPRFFKLIFYAQQQSCCLDNRLIVAIRVVLVRTSPLAAHIGLRLIRVLTSWSSTVRTFTYAIL